MKALTNILNYILLLLMLLMLVACTEETAEVDNLVRGEEYVTVRMQVPGMKAAATRADEAEDNLTSVVVLVFRNDALVSKTEVTTASSTLTTTTSTTGTFNIPRPQSGDIIHFLGNLPESVKNSLPATGGTQEDVLRGLITDDDENLSYWGKATYNGDDITVTLYRNMAKIEIAAGDECTFPEDQLFIVGLVNANQVGALVPYNGSFNFDLTTNDYFTLPADVETETETDRTVQPLVTSLYVFEHENPETADGLYVICKIGGKYYYKVALIDDTTDQPYDIIRNHRYVIYVNDLKEGVRTYELALKADPVNFEVVEMKDVTLTLTPKANTLYYNSTSEEAVTVTVGDIDSAVETLTFTAPGFTILSDYATDEGNGVFRITDRTKDAINFTLTLTDPNQTNAGTVSVTAAGKYVNSSNTSTTIQLSERAANSDETIMWQGAVEMHNNTADGTTHAGKVLIPYSFFFDANGTQKIPVNSKISLEYDKNETGYIQTYLFKDGEPSIWDISNGTELTLTQDLLTKIKDNHKVVWGVDAAFVFEGGGGAVLNKVTLIPAKESIKANITNGETLYYDSDDAQVVTVNVTIPDGVETLNISAEDFIFGEEDDGAYTYAVNSQTSATLSFKLKSGLSARTSAITFSDASGNATEDAVNVNLVETPVVTFEYSDNPMLYWNNGKPTTLQVQMNGTNVPNDKTVTLTLTITAADFTVTAQNGTPLTQNGNVWTYTGTLTTLTFTPTSSGDDKPINITGEGENVNVNPASISVDVDATLLAVTSTATIDMDNSETSTTLTLTKPGNITNLKVTASNNNAFTINGNAINGDYYIGGLSSNNETIDYTIALRDGFNTAGEYTITFTDNGGGGQSVTATITVKNTPSLRISPTSAILNLNDDTPKFEVTATVPQGSTLASLVIAAPEYITIKQSGTTLGAGEVTYSTQINGGNSVTFTFELAEGATIPNGVNSFNVDFTGSGTNLKVNSSVNVSVSNETTSSVNLEITSPSQAHATIDLGSYNSWEEKSITMQLRIPAGVKQVTFGGESINNFTISTFSGNFNNNVYTNSNSSSSQEVTFTVKIGDNASLGEHIINISGTGDGITVNGTQLVVTLTQTAFGVTPATATISNTNKSVEITIVKPKVLTQFSFVISDNDKLKATGNNMQFNDHALVYYFYQSQNTMEEVITVALNDGVTITEEGTCTITFYDNTNQTQNANTKTVTITLQP